MKKPDIFGMDSALLFAKSRPSYNMTISSNLVVEMADEIERLTAELDELKAANVECKEFIESFIKDPLEGKVYPRSAYCPMKALAKRDLESEANGVSKAITHYVKNYSKSKLSVDEFLAVYEEKLTKQAEGL